MLRLAFAGSSAFAALLLFGCGIQVSQHPLADEPGADTTSSSSSSGGSPVGSSSGSPHGGVDAGTPIGGGSCTFDAGVSDASPFPFDAPDDAYSTPLPYPECGLAPPGTPGDTATDVHNCGRCGHDCGGAACSAGQCQPCVLAASYGGQVGGIVLDGDTLYYQGPGEPETIARVSTSGGPSSTVYTTSEGIEHVDLSGGSLYVVTFTYAGSGSGALVRIDPSSGAATTVATLAGAPELATEDDSYVYVQIPIPSSGTMTVVSVSRSDGTTATLGTSSSVLGSLGGYLYFLDASGTLQRAPSGGGNLEALSGGSQLIGNRGAIAATDAFDVSLGTSIVSFDPTTGVATTLVTGEEGAFGLSLDASGLYWVASPYVRWLAQGAAGAVSIWTSETGDSANDPVEVHADGESVYWATPYGGGAPAMILKVAR